MDSIFHRIRVFFRRTMRIISESISDFIKNNDSLKASALTLYTLISIVPFLAVAFGIASGFGFAEYLEKQLSRSFDEQPEIVSHAIQFARSLLLNTQGSVIAGVGLIALLWTNLSMLSNIENALNDIWKVKRPRTWTKRFTDYLAAMIICPLFFVALSSLNVYLATRIAETAKENSILEFMSPFLLFLFSLTPILLSIFLFIVIYLFVPNAQIHIRPRIIAGVLAGIAFQLWQWIYIKFQVEISNYGVVYGTFAALPLFLLWLQTSWLILLAGAEMGAHIENEMSHTTDGSEGNVHWASRKELGLLILQRCIKAYSEGDSPLSAFQIARELGIPLLTVQQMIDTLEDGGILVEVGIRGSSVLGYQPSRDARLFTIKSVCDAIEVQNVWSIDIDNSPALERITACLDEFDKEIHDSPANLNMQQLVEGKI
ncbi:MAG: YihY family inner membrane protein [Parachlamydiaceae bacterium]|nr:YihY family inner membrane protein [Parachlamydiaceae bacterium]